MAKSFVVAGAIVECSMGTKSSKLKLPKDHSYKIKGKKVLNIADHKSNVNIMPFGNCNSTYPSKPCAISTLNPCINGKNDVLIGNKPALVNKSKCICTLGGIIRIVNDGQPISTELDSTKKDAENNKTTLISSALLSVFGMNAIGLNDTVINTLTKKVTVGVNNESPKIIEVPLTATKSTNATTKSENRSLLRAIIRKNNGKIITEDTDKIVVELNKTRKTYYKSEQAFEKAYKSILKQKYSQLKLEEEAKQKAMLKTNFTLKKLNNFESFIWSSLEKNFGLSKDKLTHKPGDSFISIEEAATAHQISNVGNNTNISVSIIGKKEVGSISKINVANYYFSKNENYSDSIMKKTVHNYLSVVGFSILGTKDPQNIVGINTNGKPIYYSISKEQVRSYKKLPITEERGYIEISSKGLAMLANFELSEGSAKRWGIGEFDSQGKMVGIYPHYVFKQVNGVWVSDGGITVGHGYWISKALYDKGGEAKELIDKYVPDASFIPPYTPSNGVAYKVPSSSYTSIGDAIAIYENKVTAYEDAVNNFLKLHQITLEQHQFDALVSFTYQHGVNWWTQVPERKLPELIRKGKGGYDPDKVMRVFLLHATPDRRKKEAEVFINGY